MNTEKTGIFYGSTTGNTETVAKQLAQKLSIDESDVMEIGSATPTLFLSYDVLLLGSSTWGVGDLQDDWEGFISDMESMNLSDKKVAVFGTGDSSSYSDTFCDAIGIIAKAAEAAGAQLIGNQVDPTEYEYDDSAALVDGCFCGLPIDEDNEYQKTDERIDNWVKQLKQSLS